MNIPNKQASSTSMDKESKLSDSKERRVNKTAIVERKTNSAAVPVFKVVEKKPTSEIKPKAKNDERSQPKPIVRQLVSEAIKNPPKEALKL
jgi:hypothetical protein